MTSPAPHTPVLTRAPITPAHAGEWSRLYTAIAESAGLMWKPTLTELTETLEVSPTFDPDRQTWAVWEEGMMIAFAATMVHDQPLYDGTNSVKILGGVHPDHRGRGISTDLLHCAEQRGAKLARRFNPGAPIVFAAFGSSTDEPAHELLGAQGYSAARYWFEMSHDLRGDLAEDARARRFTFNDAEPVRLAHNNAFSTHWGSGPSSPEKWSRYMRSAGLRPDLSRIVVEGDKVLAYAMVTSTVAGEAYLDLVGTRGEAQGSGFGRAVLISAIAAIQADGSFVKAGLDVDADNPSGAGRLYTSAGFVNIAQTVTFQKAN